MIITLTLTLGFFLILCTKSQNYSPNLIIFKYYLVVVVTGEEWLSVHAEAQEAFWSKHTEEALFVHLRAE